MKLTILAILIAIAICYVANISYWYAWPITFLIEFGSNMYFLMHPREELIEDTTTQHL